jgi:AraC family transcriptional regulator, transcriptional activator of pobA
VATERLTVDELQTEDAVQVVWLDGVNIGEEGPREPHRHDYHELIWVRAADCGRHMIDGEPLQIQPGTVTLIGRGQVHVFEGARHLHGAVVRFGDEMLFGDGATQVAPRWLLAGRGGRTIVVPESDHQRLEAMIAALDAELKRPPDTCTSETERHLLSVIMLWLERWYDDQHTESREADDADFALYRRFVEILERDFQRHHDAAHYADALGVPPAALSKALSNVTGRSTKELVTDRVMTEAARLLRFTDLTIGEVAWQVGFEDQLYFSRAFKRHFGEPPMAYRSRLRGDGKARHAVGG